MVKRMNRMFDSIPQMIDSMNEVVSHWSSVIEPKLPSHAMADRKGHYTSTVNKNLVGELARDTLHRWREAADREADGNKVEADRIFKIMYAERKTQAQGVIVAIVELIEAIGDGRELPEQFKGLMT